jgi:ribonuclease HI
MSLDPRAIQIHTDGSCYLQQNRISGCAALVVYPEHLCLPELQILDYGYAQNSNIKMELMACAKGLEWALESAPWNDVTRIYVVTDLQFLANNRNNIQYWKRNGWRYSSGGPVDHEDLWNAILKHINDLSRLGLRVDFYYKKGKKNAIGKKVDKRQRLPLRGVASMLTLASGRAVTQGRWFRVVQPLPRFTRRDRH